MARRIPGQDRLTGLSAPKRLGRTHRAVQHEIADARARGVAVSPATVTVCYVLADLLDHIDGTGEDRYLAPQLAARLLDERRAASLLPVVAAEEVPDPVDRALADFFATMGDTPPT